MELKLINGHNQIVFSDEEEKEIIKSYLSGESLRSLMKRYGVNIKSLWRLLDREGIDHSRGNLRTYTFFYPNGIFDPSSENEIKEKITEISCLHNNIKYTINEKYFNDIDTEEKAYILGFLYADGNNYLDKTQISIGLEERDKYILEKMNECFEYSKTLDFLDLSKKTTFGYHYKNMYRLVIYNKYMSNVLNLRGIVPRKSLVLEFPRWLNPILYKHFIRGYFDGDGSISKGNRRGTLVTITSTERFCRAISDIVAKEIKINSGIYDASSHNGITKVFSLSGNNVCKKFLDWLYEDSTIYLQRKHDRYIEYYNLNNSLSA